MKYAANMDGLFRSNGKSTIISEYVAGDLRNVSLCKAETSLSF